MKEKRLLKKNRDEALLGSVVSIFSKFYDPTGTARVISCIFLNEEGTILSRGWAIGSQIDSPNEKFGRMVAKGRAKKAWTRQKSKGYILRPEAVETLARCEVQESLMGNKPVLFPVVKSELWSENSLLTAEEVLQIRAFEDKKAHANIETVQACGQTG